MSWQVIKELKEKRAAAHNNAAQLREVARKDNRDLSDSEQKQHDELFASVENFGKKIELEERSAQMAESFNLKNQVGRETEGNTNNMVGMPEKDYSQYSILRAINAVINNKPLSGVEAEVNAEYAKRMGRSATGFYFPTDLPSRRVLNTTTGTGSVMTTTKDTLIDVLRPTLLSGKVGVTYLAGLQGKIALPRKTTATTAYLVAESGSPTISNPVLDQVVFIPKTMGAYTDISRQFTTQTSLDAESLVRDDILKSMGVKLDQMIFNGAGNSNEPTGILNVSGIGTVNTQGGFSHGSVVDLETRVADANASVDGACYATTPKGRGLAKVIPLSNRVAGVGFIWQNNEINGYPAYAGNVIPSTLGSGSNRSAMIFGNFADCILGLWGALDIIVDPFTGSSSGTVRVVGLQDFDVQVRHAQSFAAITDLDVTAGEDPYFA